MPVELRRSLFAVLPDHLYALVFHALDALVIALDEDGIREEIASEDDVIRILHELVKKALGNARCVIRICRLVKVPYREDYDVICVCREVQVELVRFLVDLLN